MLIEIFSAGWSYLVNVSTTGWQICWYTVICRHIWKCWIQVHSMICFFISQANNQINFCKGIIAFYHPLWQILHEIPQSVHFSTSRVEIQNLQYKESVLVSNQVWHWYQTWTIDYMKWLNLVEIKNECF
jgi:hypothetical protein